MALSLATVGAKITASFINAIVVLVNRQGLTSVIPTSVAGAGVAVSATGAVTLTAASAPSVNGCFTAGFDNYTVIVTVPTTSVANSLGLRLRAAGTDDSSANYDRQSMIADSTTVAAARTLAGTSWTSLVTGDRAAKTLTFHIYGPNLASQTWAESRTVDADAAANLALASNGLRHRSATAFDGFSLIVNTGTVTGIVRIYGWNNN